MDEDLLTISEKYVLEANDEGNNLYSAYNGGERESGNF